MSTTRKETEAFERSALLAGDFGVDVVAHDPSMLRVLQLAKSLARYHAAVLIAGETGSGKEIVARTIHRFSDRSSRPWIDVNCAALPEHLVESELFGHEKGAFSGADTAKPGLFELASGGTLFLDEIGEVDPRVQVKLLRVLDAVPFYRLGGTRKVSVDVRLIAATNRNLKAAVEAGTFRRDLYHRITECQIAVPPLRDRPLDIPALALHFLDQLHPEKAFAPEALDLLSLMNWPGNVRELRNVATKLAIAVPHELISADDIRRHIGSELPQVLCPVRDVPERATTVVEMERMMIVRALEATGGNQSRAAQQLGIPRRTFCRKLDEYQITLGRRRGGEIAASTMLASHRVEFHAAVQAVTNSGLSFNADATDISAGGIGLRSVEHPLIVGDEIRLRFSLPHRDAPLLITAAVAWCRSDGSAGAQFTCMGATHRQALLRWLSDTAQPHFPHPAQASPHQLSA